MLRRLLLMTLLIAAAPLTAEEPLFDAATGYRIRNYQASLPDSAPGAKRVWLEEIDKLVADQKAVLIDVMAAEGAGPDPATGKWRLTKSRESLPGAVWLPDVGRGVLTPAMEAYLKSNVERLTGGNKAHPVIVYCGADCWMSWNVVKRLAAYGYTGVHWFPEGTDGARDFDRKLMPVEPVPLLPGAAAK